MLIRSALIIKTAWLAGAFTIAALVGSYSSSPVEPNSESSKPESSAVSGFQEPVAAALNQEKNAAESKSDDQQEKVEKEAKPHANAHPGFIHSQAVLRQECKACHRVDAKLTHGISPHFLSVFGASSNNAKIDTAFLGIHASDVPASLSKHLKLKPEQGAIVEKVIDESPAYHCGIEEHDVVVAINNNPVKGEKSLLDKVRSQKPGTKILVEFIRAGQKQTCNVVLGKQRTAQILSSFRIKGCPTQLNSSTNCRDCHMSVAK